MNHSEIKFKKEPLRRMNGKPVFISDDNFAGMRRDLHTGFINTLKTFFRRFPWLYKFIFYVIAPTLFFGKQPKSIYEYVSERDVVVEVGSGNQRIRPTTVTVDIHPWDNVDILADAHDLPFADNSVDGIVFAWVLEHMKHPDKIAREFYRVLKPDGHFYLSTNFITPYHPSPKDYYRWTADGLRTLFSDFEIVAIGPNVGPTCAFLSVLQEWVALALSFNIKILKDLIWILMVIITAPLKLFDYIFVHYRSAETITAGFYLIAKKK